MGRAFGVAASCAAVLLLSGCAGGTRGGGFAGESAAVECAPYARLVSGFALSGDAASWWGEAAGRYARASRPVPGAALVFRRTRRLPYGHVSVVSRVVSPREILVTQANWVHHRITRGDPVIDVSPGNDWSLVRVWWAPAQAMGSRVYPAYGFILPVPAQRMAGQPITRALGGS